MSDMGATAATLSAAVSLHRAGQLEAAAEMYRALYERDRGNHDAGYGLGTVLMQLGEVDDALALLAAAADVEPGIPEYVFNHALALEKAGRIEAATNELLRASVLSAEDRPMLVFICQKLVDVGKADTVLQMLAAPANADELLVRAKAETALGHHYSACDTLTKASSIAPQSKPVWLALSRTIGRLRDFKAAISAYRRALDIEPNTAKDFLGFADLLLMAKQPDAAMQALGEARQLGIDDPDADYIEARCERAKGDMARTHELLQQAIDKRPTYGHAWQFLLETTPDAELRSFADACERDAIALATRPKDLSSLCYASGGALERLHEFGGAFAYFDRANSAQREDANARGVRYERSKADAYIVRMQAEFSTLRSGANPVSIDEQPIFIVGMPRSGTTLVERILGGFEGIRMGGESESVEQIAARYYWEINRGRARPVAALTAADWDGLQDLYWRLQTEPRSRVTDKMPTNHRHIGLMQGMFPESPIIYMRRDPRDVGLSIYSREFPDGHPYATDLEDIAHCIAHSERIMAMWKALYPDNILEIDYEELVANPVPETQKLARFCGLEWRPDCLDFHKRTDASFTFSEVQVRQPLNAKGIGRWRQYAESLMPFRKALVAHGVSIRDNQPAD